MTQSAKSTSANSDGIYIDCTPLEGNYELNGELLQKGNLKLTEKDVLRILRSCVFAGFFIFIFFVAASMPIENKSSVGYLIMSLIYKFRMTEIDIFGNNLFMVSLVVGVLFLFTICLMLAGIFQKKVKFIISAVDTFNFLLVIAFITTLKFKCVGKSCDVYLQEIIKDLQNNSTFKTPSIDVGEGWIPWAYRFMGLIILLIILYYLLVNPFVNFSSSF